MKPIAIVLFCAGAIMLGIGLVLDGVQRRKSRFGITAEAMLLERRVLGPNSARDFYFILSYTIDGKEYKRKVHAGRALGSPMPGDMVLIGYDPQDPGNIVLRKTGGNASVYAVGGVFAALGLLFQFLS